MKSYRIGDIIRARRIELNLTQEQLCDGICEPSSLSKIENGRQHPSKCHLDALLQRLGLSSEIYYALVSSDDFEAQNLVNEVLRCVVRNQSEEALHLLDKLKAVCGKDNVLIEQFILREQSIIGCVKNEKIVPYDYKTRLDMLNKAIRLTIPSFSIEKISSYLLCTEEIKVIMNIATVYSRQEDYKKSIDIYAQLMEYIDKRCMAMEEIAYLLPLVAYNYSRDLGEVSEYEKAIEVSESGRKCCIRYNKTGMLGELLATQADILLKLNRQEDCLMRIREAYYILHAMEEYKKCATLEEYVKTNFNGISI